MKFSAFAQVLGPDSGLAAEVAGVTQDSRKAAPGFLFFALHGSKADGAKYAADAAAKGALAVVAAKDADVGALNVPVIRVDDPRRALALSAATFYGRQPETMIAVTGTAGKTSVAGFTRQIWAHGGFAAASIGTTGVVAPGRNDYGTLTTPDPVELHRAGEDGADALIEQIANVAHQSDRRIYFDALVKLKAGAFTNLGRDHLDYHPTIEDYLKAKLRLFDTLLDKGTPAVIFADDPFTAPVIEVSRKAGLQVLTVGRKGGFISVKRVEHERRRQRVEVSHGGRIYEIDLPFMDDVDYDGIIGLAYPNKKL